MELSFNMLACSISVLTLVILTYNIYTKKIKREDQMGIKLCWNIYFAILTYSCTLVSTNIRSLLGDIYGISFDTSSCIASGYLALIFLYILYISFINQAFYRLVRIVYFRTVWIEKDWIQIVLITLVCCLLLVPLINWHGVIYYKNDYFCYASFSNLLGILWAAAVVYIIPFLILFSIYIFITKYLKQQRTNLTLVMRLRQNRDFVVIQRVLIIVFLLLVLGVPAMTLVVYTAIIGKEHPLTIRIAFFTVSISVSTLTISLIFTIPQLKTIIEKLFRTNRVRISIHTMQNPNTTRPRTNSYL